MNDDSEPHVERPAAEVSPESNRAEAPVSSTLPGKPWGIWMTGAFTAILVATHLVTMVGAILLLTVLPVVGAATPGMVLALTIILTAFAVPLLCALFASAAGTLSVREYLALKNVSWLSLFLWAGGCLLAAWAFEAIGGLFGLKANLQLMQELYESTTFKPLFWIAVVIAAPIWEEFLFRGFLYAGLRESWLGERGTVLATSLLFGGIHASQYDTFGVVATIGVGLMLGIGRAASGSLYVPIAMHIANNALAMVQLAGPTE
jgi:membrane protease YdiL (CAAX protease family)